MDEETKKTLEKYSALTEAMKPGSAVLKAFEDINRSMAKVPKFDIPSITSPAFRIPEISRMPTQEEVNEYQSSSILMQTLSEEALDWKRRLPKNFKPAILAVLYGGIQIHVQTLAKVSFHGIQIAGTMNGAPCSLLAHQSTVQLLCYAEEVKPDTVRNPIGFVWDDKKIEV